MPKDNIERAIARGAGADADSEAYDSVTYEGYGASGAALIVEALTDNRNRTAADVRFAFGKYGGSLGDAGRGGVAVRAQGRHHRAGDVQPTRTRSRSRRPRAGPRTSRADGDMWLITSEPHDLGTLRTRSRRRASRSRAPT